jgi:TolB-like protein
MKRWVVLISLIAGMGASLCAQQLTVAVSPFDVRNGVTADVAEVVTELFTANLVATGNRLRVVDRNGFDKIIAEMKFQASDWANGSRVAQLGKALNANSIIRGNISALAGQIVITAYILDINTAQILSASSVRVSNTGQIFDRIPALSNGIVTYLSNLSNRPNTALGQYTVVISPFDIRGGMPPGDAGVLMDMFTTLVVINGAKVVDRNSFERIAREMQFQASDWSDGTRLAQLGRALNANAILRGSIMSLAGQTVITATILDINTAQILSSSTLQMGGVAEIFAKLPDFVSGLDRNLGILLGVDIVGKKGPAGGFVFYDKGSYSDGWRFLEAAPAETEFTAEWGGYRGPGGNSQDYSNIPGTDTSVGSGKQNTQVIIDFLRGINISGRAVQRCAGLNVNGFTDWFLPSKDELDLMYKNLRQKGVGNFKTTQDINNQLHIYYWSSSQYDNGNAWYQDFRDGSQYTQQGRYSKRYIMSVRAVRAF